MDNYGLLFSKSLGGGGGSGTTNYNELSNKPQINSVTLSGNKSLEALGIQSQLTFDTEPTEDSTNPVESGGVYSALASKQDTLTIDDTPTENSSNPVQSGGTYTALAGKQDTLTFDDSPTNGSSNPVKSGGVYSALSDKQDTLTFEGTYNASSNRAATESTVSDAIKALDVAGASGIAASKTISAWSETDGKASISTQDIAIAGTQTTLTGYAKSGTAGQAVAATDNVNQAIGKLEATVDDNKNNILLNWGGAKNLTTITGGTTEVANRYVINNQPLSLVAGDYVVSFRTTATTGANAVTIYDSNANTVGTVTIANATGTVYGDITITANSANIYVYATVPETITEFMICTKADWEKSPVYAPNSMTNIELTAAIQALQAQLANQ